MNKWETNACQQLTHELEQVEQIRHTWHQDGCGLDVKGEVLDELLHHYVLAYERASTFLGRDDLLQSALDIILNNNSAVDNNSSKEEAVSLDRIHLGIIGQSGIGKSSFMAKLAASLAHFEQQKQKNSRNANGVARPVIIRFCGTTSDSSTGLGLVHSVIMQILILINEKTQFDTIPREYSEAVKLLHELLHKYAVSLLIDGIDQLTDQYLARSRISFLHGLTCHPNTKIILSCLPDERDVEGNWIHYYGCETRLREKKQEAVHILQMNHHQQQPDAVSMELIVCRLLERDYKMQLIPAQKDVLMYHIMLHQPPPTMLFIKLAVKIASSWSSSVQQKQQQQQQQPQLASTMKGLIHQIFDTLERDYGRQLTRAAMMGFLTFSRYDVNDLELEDLLSLHEQVKYYMMYFNIAHLIYVDYQHMFGCDYVVR